MEIAITWLEIIERLALSLLAGALLGLNRGQHGRPAGLRTTALVCLAAGASMVLANILLDTTGKPADSFVNFDVMRLPLGVLTGVGFIGAGAILHRGNLVIGVTTAATLWFSTVMGFFFGAGQYQSGLLLLGMGAFILWVMDWIEGRLPSRHDATLRISISPAPADIGDKIKMLFLKDGYDPMLVGLNITPDGEERHYEVSWHATGREDKVPACLGQLSSHPGIRSIRWEAVGRE